MLELVLRFLLIGSIAFGGGQAALPLVERLTVVDTGWLTETEFATGVGLSYATPGPVLVLSSFVGYYVGGVMGAVLAAFAVFAVPMVLAGFAAQLAGFLQERQWFRCFGRYAAAAAIGLLGLTVLSLSTPIFNLHPALLLGIASVVVAAQFSLHPLIILGVAVSIGAGIGVAVA